MNTDDIKVGEIYYHEVFEILGEVAHISWMGISVDLIDGTFRTWASINMRPATPEEKLQHTLDNMGGTA